MRSRVKGLECAGCAANVERKLREVVAEAEPGVEIVEDPAEYDADEYDADEYDADEDDEDRWRLPVIILSGILLAIGLLFNSRLRTTPHSWAEYAVLLTPYLLVGWPVIWKAFKNLGHGHVFDENFLMTVATAGAVIIHELPEAAAVMVFYSLGEYLQDRSVDCSRRTIRALLEVHPEYANLQSEGGLLKVPPEEVSAGQVIVVKPGEKVPLDGEVLEGRSFVDTSALTGEPVPAEVSAGKKVLAGMVNGQGLLTVRVTKPFAESSISRILELVESASSRKALTEQFMTAFARYYTPVVVFGALALAIVPPLVVPGQSFSAWVYRALVMLVISCPCALVVSIPLGYFGGIGASARHGILVKGANFLDALANLHTVVFDKTGTLTKGVFEVTEVVPANGFDRDTVLSMARAVEAYSTHPIAESIRRARPENAGTEQVADYWETPGRGVGADVDGLRVLAGSVRFLRESEVAVDEGEAFDEEESRGAEVYVAIDKRFAGRIVISDEIKSDARSVIESIRKLGVRKTVMLTGDGESAARSIAMAVGVDDFYAGLLPEEKVQKVEVLRSSITDPKRQKLAFVGDGINDAPVIARADVGIAMGGLGSDAAIEAADVVLMEDALSKLATAIRIAKRTGAIVRQNVAFALGTKLVFIALNAWGLATIWEAVFADVGVTLIAVLNAMRTLRYKDPVPGVGTPIR